MYQGHIKSRYGVSCPKKLSIGTSDFGVTFRGQFCCKKWSKNASKNASKRGYSQIVIFCEFHRIFYMEMARFFPIFPIFAKNYKISKFKPDLYQADISIIWAQIWCLLLNQICMERYSGLYCFIWESNNVLTNVLRFCFRIKQHFVSGLSSIFGPRSLGKISKHQHLNQICIKMGQYSSGIISTENLALILENTTRP